MAAPDELKPRAKTPFWSPSCPVLCQATMNPPPAAMAIAGAAWFPVVNALIWNSRPTAAPAESKRRAKMPTPLPSWFELQATRKSPSASLATLGEFWGPLVAVLIWNSTP